MESWDDKILADKLNNLQDLPAGYTPDLSSKWEIVEAGLPTGKKRRLAPLLIRWSVAAAVLLAIGLLWTNTGKKEAASLALQGKALQPASPIQQQQLVETSQNPVNTNRPPTSHPPHQTTATTTNKKVKPAEALAYQLLPGMATIPVREEDTNRGSGTAISLATDSVFPKAIQQAMVATVSEEKQRLPKKKIYQRDFNDGVLVMDTGFNQPATQHFSIQLNPFRRKAADDEPPARRLQLKQAL